MNDSLAVLVLSCDKYEFLWDNFFDSFESNFRAKLPVYIATNTKSYQRLGVTTVNSNKKTDWSDELIEVLKKIPEENLLIMLEDAPLTKIFDVNEFNQLYKCYTKESWNYLGLKGTPRSKNSNRFIKLGVLEPGYFYRASLIFAIWRKSVLIDILRAGESAWEFEVNGSIRSDKHDKFFCTRKSIISFDHLLIKGEFNRSLRKKYASLISLNNIKIMTRWDWVRYLLNDLSIRLVLSVLPLKYHRKIRGLKESVKKILQ